MKVLAALMIAVGVLIAGLSGLCTAVFSLAALSAGTRSNVEVSRGALWLCLMVGAPFIGLGLALVVGGRRLWRKRPRD